MSSRLFVALLMAASFAGPAAWYVFSGLAVSSQPLPELYRPTPLFDQAVVVVTAFVVKPLYMLLSLFVAWSLRKARHADLAAVRRGALAFFLGEAFCALNYLLFHDQAYPAEFLHSFGMLVAFGFIGYGLLHGLDTRIAHYSDLRRTCSLIGLCGVCTKTQAVPCKGRKLFRLIVLSVGVLSLIPLMTNPGEISYGTHIFGTFYQYTWLRADQVFELRFSPVLALLMFLSASAILWGSVDRLVPQFAQICFCAGMGALVFGLMRLCLGTLFSTNLAWSASWEEITEFLLMIAIVYGLIQFRRVLEMDVELHGRMQHGV